MTKRKKIAISVCIIVLALAIAVPVVYFVAQNKTGTNGGNINSGNFSYEPPDYIASDEDKKIAEPILKEVEGAIAYDGYKADFPYDPNLLKLCCTRDEDDSFDHVQSDVRFVTFKKVQDNGYLWVNYDQTYCAKDGTILFGSSEIPLLVEVHFDNANNWTVTSTSEPA